MSKAKNGLSESQKEMYRRNILLKEIGEAGQLKLLQSRVLVIGAGGLGSPALFYLAACGVGEVGIVDGDRVERSNLQRQILHGHADLGKEKTLSALETLSRLRDDLRIELYPFCISEANIDTIIAPYDFVIEATDNFESKFLINDACVNQGKAFSHAGILETYGQTMTIVPGGGPCFRCVFEDVPPPDAVKAAHEAGVLGSLPGVLGTIQATEAVKYLLGRGRLLVGRMLTWDAFSMVFREVKLPGDKRCRVCEMEHQMRNSTQKGGKNDG